MATHHNITDEYFISKQRIKSAVRLITWEKCSNFRANCIKAVMFALEGALFYYNLRRATMELFACYSIWGGSLWELET